MKEKLLPLVYLAAATLLVRGLYLLATPGGPAKKNLPRLLKAGLGPVLIADLIFPPVHRKTPAS
jgi:hypothetical protein